MYANKAYGKNSGKNFFKICWRCERTKVLIQHPPYVLVVQSTPSNFIKINFNLKLSSAMATAKIVRVLDKTVNKNGVECRIGFTADYIEDNVFHPGQIVYTENDELFDQFQIGLQVELE